MKKAFQIALLFLLLGCGGAIKKSWIDFRAYYNTYYNAIESYRAGLEQVKDQPREINVNEPIRVYQPPLGSADQQFQNSIDKGAQILRKFPESKWVDETLELIGKSYYYRQEYYSALQKFEEQYKVAENPEMRQRAVVWKGRVLLDLEMYNEGSVFLEDELSKLSGEWQPELEGKTEVLLAEHYAHMEQWDQVEQLLAQALPKLPKSSLKARAYFLHGQILEISEQYGPAADAYNQVSANRPGFDLLYWSNYKQAESLRKMGNLEQALAIYDKMRKDDKNVERLPEIYYEIAKTQEAMGNYRAALQIYKDVLRSKTYQVDQETKAEIYYQLGQIYTNDLNRYQLAAAYYDSSSSLRSSSARTGILQEEFDTETLAQAYGRYSELRSQIHRLDSLLWLGNLPEAERDSVIAEIEERRIQELEEQRNTRRGRTNVLTNVSAAESTGNETGTSSAYGFLNHKNSRLLADARRQFQAVWGNRPLVDDWRRVEAVRSSGVQQDSSQGEAISAAEQAPKQTQNTEINVDLSEIPFTEEQQKETLDKIGSAKFELGNLFLLTLQKPDSAAHYFKAVVEEHPDHSLVPKALYSLYELLMSEDEQQQAEEWARRLRQEYPDSRYTRQLEQRTGEEEYTGHQDSTEFALSLKADSILSSKASAAEIASELRHLALANKEASAAPLVHYESIKYYIQLAKDWDNINIELPQLDSLLIGSVKTDSTSKETTELQYQGVYWDSVRTVLKEHAENFSGDPSVQKVNKLSEELAKAAKEDKERKTTLPTCKERGIEPQIRGGMTEFLGSIELPGSLANAKLPETIDYEITITARGEVEAYKLISEKINPAIEEAFAEGIKENLVFMPLALDKETPRVRCPISFPISQ